MTELLDCIDKSANSNTLWLHFEINSEKEFDIAGFLVTQLQIGNFHSELVKSDSDRGWENYTISTYPENLDEPVIISLKPGTTWNGKANLTTNAISTEDTTDLMMDLLTGEQKYFSKSPLGKTLCRDNALEIVNSFMASIYSKNPLYYKIEPDFLWLVDEALNDEDSNEKLGYFEGDGRDFALAILAFDKQKMKTELNLLLVNGYS